MSATEYSPLERKIDEAIGRFWQGVNKEGPIHPVLKTKCWSWIGTKFASGYGKIVSPIEVRAHRFSFKLLVGDIPDNLYVLHRCDNRECVNPEHLFLGNHLKNMKDMTDKGRQAKGEKSNLHKLSEKEVLEIRDRYIPYDSRHGVAAIARELGYAYHTIYFIISRVTWKHV